MAYKGGARSKATLKYDDNLYTPTGAKALTDKELRTEYSRLRSIARKRLERFEGTEWKTSQIYKYNKEGFKPLAEIKTDRELRMLLSDVARFVTAERGSVSGLEKERKQSVKTLNERGYTFVNKKNFRKFAEFMEYVRTANLNRIFDSKRVADFYEATEKRNFTNNEMRNAFKSWSRSQRKQNKIQNNNKKDSKNFRKALE